VNLSVLLGHGQTQDSLDDVSRTNIVLFDENVEMTADNLSYDRASMTGTPRWLRKRNSRP
jgi:hypothetical protein